MTYHDNVVSFIASGCSLVSGEYTVDECKVTNGQDPDNYNYSGLKVTCGSNGALIFKVGRKGSSEVAEWFNKRIGDSNNTFNHSAGDLNFAFIGTLKLTITGGPLGNVQHTYIFPRIALAQGHSGSTNNWWFGGSFCTYTGNEKVLGKGLTTDIPAVEVTFSFKRGGNSVDKVDFDIHSL